MEFSESAGESAFILLLLLLTYFWPFIVPGLYLIIKRGRITSKIKFFLLSIFGSQAFNIIFYILIVSIPLDLDSENNWLMILALVWIMIIFIFPLFLSHMLSKKYSKQSVSD